MKRILFPVDFSESCIGAARYVEAFAGHFEAEVMLLHTVGMGEYHLPEELLPSRRARQWNPDLVMMATHGLGAFRRLLIGSVTAKVLHDLHLPVWTSVHSEKAPPLEEIHCRRILCALDLSPRSQHILEWASALADEFDAELGIVHATEDLPEAYLAGDLEREIECSLAANAQRRIKILQEAAGITGPAFVQAGDPAKVVACAAQQFRADLLVMGRHSTAGVTGYLRQSAWDILRDSPCPAISI